MQPVLAAGLRCGLARTNGRAATATGRAAKVLLRARLGTTHGEQWLAGLDWQPSRPSGAAGGWRERAGGCVTAGGQGPETAVVACESCARLEAELAVTQSESEREVFGRKC